MKETPRDARTRVRMMPGAITLNGFIGKDKRSLPEIIAADEVKLQSLNRTATEIAERMKYFVDASFSTFDGKITIEGIYVVETEVTRGYLQCPYSHGGKIRKSTTCLTNTKTGVTVTWTAMNIHLIEDHGFFEGKGSTYRLEPEQLVKALF
ncbi:MAG: hypothetical protein PHO32_04275 [Candidatus Cloacimonetes bacterium]|nr:hypothetical protein [Candidatus Cloacimonadota bacterium]